VLASVFNPSLRLVRRTDSAFEHDRARRVADFGIGAAHDARDADRPLAVGDDEHVGRQRAVLAVERLQALAVECRADPDLVSGQPGGIEGMHRLAEFEQHIVGDVDDIADRTDAAGLEPCLHPRR
jgi:hypothetical protein